LNGAKKDEKKGAKRVSSQEREKGVWNKTKSKYCRIRKKRDETKNCKESKKTKKKKVLKPDATSET